MAATLKTSWVGKLWSTPRKTKKKKVALVLGSGGSKGWAHLGVLQVLAEHDLKFDLVAGSSFGAIAGAFSASDNLQGLAELASESNSLLGNIGYLDFGGGDNGLIGGRKFVKKMETFLPVSTFEELQRPLGIVATDLCTSQEVFFRQGNLSSAIRASIAIPGLLSPVKFDRFQFGDGGIINSLPVNLARHMGADTVIAVDLNQWLHEDCPSSTLGILHRASEIMSNQIRLYNRWQFPADVYIEPRFEGSFNIFDFHRSKECIAYGRQAAMEKLPQIQKIMQGMQGQGGESSRRGDARPPHGRRRRWYQINNKLATKKDFIRKIHGLDYHEDFSIVAPNPKNSTKKKKRKAKKSTTQKST